MYFPTGVIQFIENVAKKYSLSFEKVKEAYRGKEARAYWAGKLSDKEYWSFFMKTLGITSTFEELLALFIKGYTVDANVANLVRRVRKNYKTIIFTNNFAARFTALDKKFNFTKDFDVKIISYEVGEAKPHVKMEQALLKQSGCKPDEIIVIDDQLKNIAPMKEKGFNIIHFQNYEQLIKELEQRGVAID